MEYLIWGNVTGLGTMTFVHCKILFYVFFLSKVNFFTALSTHFREKELSHITLPYYLSLQWPMNECMTEWISGCSLFFATAKASPQSFDPYHYKVLFFFGYLFLFTQLFFFCFFDLLGGFFSFFLPLQFALFFSIWVFVGFLFMVSSGGVLFWDLLWIFFTSICSYILPCGLCCVFFGCGG